MPKLNILKSKEVKKRIFVNGKQNCSITLKDHNPNFQNNPALRLLNPAKNELGRISETILDKTSVIDYILIDGKTHKKLLIGLKAYNKQHYKFIMFDIKVLLVSFKGTLKLMP